MHRSLKCALWRVQIRCDLDRAAQPSGPGRLQQYSSSSEVGTPLDSRFHHRLYRYSAPCYRSKSAPFMSRDNSTSPVCTEQVKSRITIVDPFTEARHRRLKLTSHIRSR
nr:hypothetical protein CFP56_36382 [Quercus suber]